MKRGKTINLEKNKQLNRLSGYLESFYRKTTLVTRGFHIFSDLINKQLYTIRIIYEYND